MFIESITKAEAIRSLSSSAEFAIRGADIEWINTTPIDETLIQAEVTRLQEVYDSQEYARKRRADYPTIEECIHAILDNDLEALQSKRAEVKLRYPK
jgi:hypothetical protein